MKRRIVFVDRDGTLIREPDDHQVDELSKIELMPGVIPALIALTGAGYELVMVTNQPGLGTAAFPQPDFERCQAFLLELLRSQGIEFAEIYVCPHAEAARCECRKPRAGLLVEFLATHDIDLAASAMVGDRDCDVQLSERLGVAAFRLGSDLDWAEVARELLTRPRRAEVVRNTKETKITVAVDLDASAPISIDTGIGFYDHMLEQLAKHAGFALQLRCQGDLQIDDHHTVEDVALALGQALREALGDKRGIGRFGFLLPMDETLAQVAVDLSGRPFAVFEGDLSREQVGGLATELVPHFFRSLSDSLGAAIHIKVTGSNAHHMVEAAFKGLARALRPALARSGTELPSTKGTL